MRYSSTEEANNDHIKNYRSDGWSNGKGQPNSPDYHRVEFVLHRVTDDSHVLDVGCNGGTISIRLKSLRKCRVKGIDIVPELVEKAKKRGVFAQLGRAESLDFRDNQFDHVICTEVLEHLYEPEQAIAEAYRVLKPGGTYIITVPSHESDGMGNGKLGDFHHQNFTPNDLLSLIRNSGFGRSSISTYGIAYTAKYCELNGLDPKKAQWIGVEVIKDA